MKKVLNFVGLILLISGNNFTETMFSKISKVYSNSFSRSSNLSDPKRLAFALLLKKTNQKSSFSTQNNFSKKNKQKSDGSNFNQESHKSNKSKNKAFKLKQKKIFLKLGSLGTISLGVVAFNLSDIKKNFLEDILKSKSLNDLTLDEIEQAFKCAIETGHVEVVKQLLTCYDIDINAQDKYGYTALMLAAFYGHTEIFELLIAHPDIKVDIQNKRGETAADMAYKREHEYIYNLLLSDNFFQF